MTKIDPSLLMRATGEGPTPHHKRPYKHRLLATSILAYLLYGTRAIHSRDSQTVTFFLGPLSRQLRLANARLLDSLEWLREFGFIDSFTIGAANIVTVTTLPPKAIGGTSNA